MTRDERLRCDRTLVSLKFVVARLIYDKSPQATSPRSAAVFTIISRPAMRAVAKGKPDDRRRHRARAPRSLSRVARRHARSVIATPGRAEATTRSLGQTMRLFLARSRVAALDCFPPDQIRGRNDGVGRRLRRARCAVAKVRPQGPPGGRSGEIAARPLEASRLGPRGRVKIRPCPI